MALATQAFFLLHMVPADDILSKCMKKSTNGRSSRVICVRGVCEVWDKQLTSTALPSIPFLLVASPKRDKQCLRLLFNFLFMFPDNMLVACWYSVHTLLTLFWPRTTYKIRQRSSRGRGCCSKLQMDMWIGNSPIDLVRWGRTLTFCFLAAGPCSSRLHNWH